MSHAMTESPGDTTIPIEHEPGDGAPSQSAKANWGFVVLGIAMMFGSLIVSAIVPAPSESLQLCNRAFMAIGGGLAAGGILGFVNVSVPLMNRQAIRGSGGFGVFLVLYFFNPPFEVAYVTTPKSKRQAVAKIVQTTLADSNADRREVRATLQELGFKGMKDFTIRASDEDISKLQDTLKSRVNTDLRSSTPLNSTPTVTMNRDAHNP